MKKIFIVLGLIITFFIIYLIQANFFTWFTIFGVMPNLFIIYILFIGLFIGKKSGFILGIIFGVCIDFLIGKSIGITGLMLGLIGIFAEYIDKNFSKDSRMTIMLIVAISTAVYDIGIYTFQILRWGAILEIIPFFKILLIETLFNVILVIILYPLIQKIGSKLENLFKNKTVLTRYF